MNSVSKQFFEFFRTWNFWALAIAVTMIVGMFIVAQGTIWPAPPYLYDTDLVAKSKLALPLAWLPLILIAQLSRPKGKALLAKLVIFLGLGLAPIFACISIWAFIIGRTIPFSSQCQQLNTQMKVPPQVVIYSCKTYRASGDEILTFVGMKDWPFMILVGESLTGTVTGD